MHNISREARVGVVAALAIFCFAFMVVFLKAVKISRPGDTYYVVFTDAGRVIKGTDVNMAGVRVGEVHKVKLNPETNMAQVELVIDRDFKIHKSYQFRISKAALIGQSTIDIIPFAPRNKGEAEVIHPNTPKEPIVGVTPASVDTVIPEINETLRTIRDTTSRLQKIVSDPEIVDSFKHAAGDVHATVENLKKLIGDPRLAEAIRRSLANVERASDRAVKTMASLEKLAGDLRGVIGENRGEIKATFAQVHETVTHLQDSTKQLRATLTDLKIKESFEEVVGVFKKSLANFEATTAKLKQVAEDPEITGDLKKLLAQARESTDNLRAATDSLKQFIGDEQMRNDLKMAVKDGRETVALAKETLASTREALAPTQETMTNLRSASADLAEAMKSAKSATERVDKFLNRSNPLQSASEGLQPDLSFRHLGQSGITASDLNLRVGGGKSFFSTGLSDIGNGGVRFSLQKGVGFGGGAAARFGVYRSQVGLGLDQTFGSVRGAFDVYDPARPRYTSWFSLPMTKQYELMVGMERDRRGRDFVGAGLRLRPF